MTAISTMTGMRRGVPVVELEDGLLPKTWKDKKNRNEELISCRMERFLRRQGSRLRK